MEQRQKIMQGLKQKTSMPVDKYVGMLLASAPAAHIYHLNTKSIAEHIATKKYYKGIVDLADDLAEAYMGENPSCHIMPCEVQYPKTAVEFFSNLLSSAESMTSQMSPDIANINQEITALIKKTIYQLTNLS
jgi:hypothetical protein